MSKKKLTEFVERYCKAVQADCDARFHAFPKDAFDPELSEVALGLLARQGSLAIELARSPGIWNQHVAPLVHRAMSDVFITLAYILKEDSQRRALDFILYGLGQEKLAIAHIENDLKERGKNPDKDKLLEARRQWLNSQRYEHLTVVNTGSATGKSTRDMAAESDNLSIYDFNFTPFSACVHSTWQHVARFNLRRCDNPMHGGHRVPIMPDLPPGSFELWVATKTLRRTLEALDDFTGQNLPYESWTVIDEVKDDDETAESSDSTA